MELGGGAFGRIVRVVHCDEASVLLRRGRELVLSIVGEYKEKMAICR